MQSGIKDIFKQIMKSSKKAGRVVVISLIAAMILQSFGPISMEETVAYAAAETSAEGYLDKVIFGNAQSESAHSFKGEYTSVITGFLGESARDRILVFRLKGKTGI